VDGSTFGITPPHYPKEEPGLFCYCERWRGKQAVSKADFKSSWKPDSHHNGIKLSVPEQ
jgi:hypothetical protein